MGSAEAHMPQKKAGISSYMREEEISPLILPPALIVIASLLIPPASIALPHGIIKIMNV